jgi:VTC domain
MTVPARDSTVIENFERFEFKYWAPPANVDLALRMLDGHMQEDEVALRAGATQVNTSLYFDSPRFTFLDQHLASSPDRIKLRVRYYGERPSGDCFFEIKRRQNAVVMKRRAVLSLPEARVLVHDVSSRLPVHNAALEGFQYLALRCSAEPKLLVRARRQALRSSEPGVDVRLTVDRDMAWQPPRGQDPLTPRPERWRTIHGRDERPWELVEIKFRSARPWWLGSVTQLLSPWRVSFSKYVAAALAARVDPFFTTDAA